MRSRSFRRLRVGGVVLFIVSTALATVTAPAGADGNVSLPGLTQFAHMKVDSSHVFITSGTGTTSILVTNFAGATVANIGNQSGADGMAFSTDGSTLYVALSSADAISAINTATLTEITRYATGATTCPHAVAVAGGKLWFGYGCGGGSGQIGSVDTSTAPATVTLAQSAQSWYNAPIFATSPGNTNLLVAGEQGESPSHATIYDVSTGSPVAVATKNVGSNLGDIEISPDATKLYVSDGAVYYEQVFSTSDFANVTTYSTGGPYPTATALSADGRVVATGRNGHPDVYLYLVGAPSAYRNVKYDDPSSGYPSSVAQGGMAFSPSGGELFVVSTAYGTAPVLHIIVVPEKTPTSLGVAAPATAARGAAVTVHGILSPYAGPVTTPQVLTVTKHDLSGTHVLPNVATSASGAFSFANTTPIGGPNTYTVSWAGDTNNLNVSSHTTVNVARRATSISVAINHGTIQYQHAVTVTARLRGTYNSRVVTIYAQSKGVARRAIKSGKVNSHGLLKVAAHPGRDTTFTAVFDGDYHFAPASAARRALVRADVSAKALGWYTKTSAGVRVYHHSVNPQVAAHLLPTGKTGEKLCYPLQVATGGSWRTVDRKCFAVDGAGASFIYVYGSNRPGDSYRFRAEYAGDSTNASATSSWYLFTFTT